MKKFYSPPAAHVIEGFVSGNPADLKYIYDALSTPLFKIILLKVKDINTAEYLLETAFLTAWQCRTEYAATGVTIIHWLHQICIQTCDSYLLVDKRISIR